MDAKAQKAYRARLKESVREKRIDSPLIRYNENGQPVCRVCNIVLKSETLWPAHQASRKHKEAIEKVKATAAGHNRTKHTNIEPPTESHKAQTSTLPSDFFDNREMKRQKNDIGKPVSDGSTEVSPVAHVVQAPESGKKSDKVSDVHSIGTKEQHEKRSSSNLGQDSKKLHGNAKQVKGGLPENFFDSKGRSDNLVSAEVAQVQIKQAKRSLPDDFFESNGRSEINHSNELSESSKSIASVESKQVKGILPEGFFDNRDADLRARGIEPVKVDIDDAYKEFEKEIQDNLQEVDDRLEEEEIDAADVREEVETLEQQAYMEQMENVKMKVLQVKAARTARKQESPASMDKESSDDSSSEGDDDDANFAVDWRAQHL
ncbi:hypothetical protein J5N97_009136 [Dioscorea zingiberensis]|uniref:C2H2-type domain-containing protein n=1 Tax=Dioscorea zingiberensis TaxID=325984 RepID=A0A9D5HLP2_9LILI|nr:hypothetical protein J5N97_009136 [Dioscorea zingiberensis]